MDILAVYPSLAGSSGTIRLQMNQQFIDDVCALLKRQLPNSVADIRITASGKNRFLLNAELSSHVVAFLGKPFLSVLQGDGIELEITQGLAAHGTKLEGRLETTLIGKQVVDYVIKALNEAIGEPAISSNSGWLSGSVTVSLDPFPLLNFLLPGGIGNDISQVQWQTTEDAFYIDLIWQHNGGIYPQNPKGPSMDAAIQAFLDKMMTSQFADLKGSYADLSLQLSERVLNDLLAVALTQQAANPFLSLVRAAKVNGSLTAQISLKV